MPPRPKTDSVDTAVTDPSKTQASDLLLKHCLSMGALEDSRPSAKLRLEEAVLALLGPGNSWGCDKFFHAAG